tara:strand:+ start:97 stop:369 length:273 start_codon:yes stop_codon:yes gene_type:complete
MDLAKDDKNVFVTDFSDLIKQGICPHCRCLIQDISSLMIHIKNCDQQDNVITTKWFTKKEIEEKNKFLKRKESIEFGISFYKSDDRPQTR